MDTLAPFKVTGLTGREYKMMLDPMKFTGEPKWVAARFWKSLLPVVAAHMDDANGLGSFDEVFVKAPVNRPVRFKGHRGAPSGLARLQPTRSGSGFGSRSHAQAAHAGFLLKRPDRRHRPRRN
jgi:hypothetical protein